jgi:hypothetical protein
LAIPDDGLLSVDRRIPIDPSIRYSIIGNAPHSTEALPKLLSGEIITEARNTDYITDATAASIFVMKL